MVMKRTLLAVVLTLALSLIMLGTAAGKDFYKGKTVRIIVGYSPGGGFDTFSRLIGRYLGKHIPGNPTIIVMNMPGAGSLVAANRVYAMQPGDGLAVAVFNFGLIPQALTGDSTVTFDPQKYIWLGDPAIGSLPEVLWVHSDLPIRTLDELKNSKKPVALGVTGIGSPSTAASQFLASLGYPLKIIYGYRGTANVMAAMERKELDGRFMSQATMQGNYKRYIKSGLVRPVLSLGDDPRLTPIAGVPTFATLNLKGDQKKMAKFLVETWKLLRLFGLPPGTPADRVEILRNAFIAALKSPELQKDAERQGIVVSPASPETVTETIRELYASPPEIIKAYKTLMTPKG